MAPRMEKKRNSNKQHRRNNPSIQSTPPTNTKTGLNGNKTKKHENGIGRNTKYL